MKNTLIAYFFGLAAASLGPFASASIDIFVSPEGDGYYHNELGTSYDFFDATAQSNSVHYQFYGTSDTMQQNTAYAQFSLASVSPGTQVGAATLNIYLTEIHYSDESPSGGNIHHVANASSANGQASQKIGGNELVTNIKDQPLGWLALDITSYIQNDIDNAYGYSAFSFTADTSGYFRNAGFSFTSGDAVANQPYISITTVPETKLSALLCGLGVLVYIIHSRRR